MQKPVRQPIIAPSTRSFLRESRRVPGFRLFDFLHGYFYLRFPFLYISMATGEHPLAKRLRPLLGTLDKWFTPKQVKADPDLPDHTVTFADGYHGKVMPLADAKELITIGQDLRISVPEQVIPYITARDLILQNPDFIVALDCPCRVARPNPCLPLDVCLIVGEPFASFTLEHQPEHCRRISPQEAVAILEAEDKRGHVHHAFFKEAVLERFYAICNCCDCCCGAMQAQRHGTPMLASSGYTARIAVEACAACGNCREFCQFHALIEGEDGTTRVDAAKCMGCGVCVSHCPQEAIELELTPARGVPLEIHKLMEQAAAAQG